tara:strand:+ start:326 stop:493 length:168 start_codon:yes stop_codon:yes gene_type:complete
VIGNLARLSLGLARPSASPITKRPPRSIAKPITQLAAPAQLAQQQADVIQHQQAR